MYIIKSKLNLTLFVFLLIASFVHTKDIRSRQNGKDVTDENDVTKFIDESVEKIWGFVYKLKTLYFDMLKVMERLYTKISSIKITSPCSNQTMTSCNETVYADGYIFNDNNDTDSSIDPAREGNLVYPDNRKKRDIEFNYFTSYRDVEKTSQEEFSYNDNTFEHDSYDRQTRSESNYIFQEREKSKRFIFEDQLLPVTTSDSLSTPRQEMFVKLNYQTGRSSEEDSASKQLIGKYKNKEFVYPDQLLSHLVLLQTSNED